MLRTQHAVQGSGSETLALQAGLAQWRTDLDAMLVWPLARLGTRPSAEARAQAARRAQHSLYWDGRALRITRSDSGGQGVRVVAWALAPVDGQWLRWQSAPLTATQDWRAAWQAAGEWGRAPQALQPQQAGGASAVAIARAGDWRIHYFRRNAWSNALSSGDEAQQQEEHTTLPDGVRLALTLAPGQSVEGEIILDWVRPSFGGLQ